jgi:hypothetical protein
MAPPDLPIAETISRLSLKQKLAQMFLLNFVGYTDVCPSIRALNAKGLLGGIIFFSGSNVQDIEQLRRLTTRIQDLVKESPVGIPSLITLDQEGGQLTALHRGATVFPGRWPWAGQGTSLSARRTPATWEASFDGPGSPRISPPCST